MIGGCARELEVVAAVRSGAWDEADELRQHVDTCMECQELATLARLLADDHAVAASQARVPTAGQVWWRAAIRMRHEAARAASRPLTWLYGVIGALAVGLVAAVLPAAGRMMDGWANAVSVAASDRLASATTVVQTPVALALGSLLLLALSIACYLALADD